MGVVYKAKQPGLNRLVALKMILRGKGSKKERDLFKAEAEVIARLQHVNIVQIYEIGEHHEALYFSLEYVEGGCLADVVAKQRPTPRQAAQVLLALAEGMDAAHSQGIVHRDLKPANVLLGGKPGAPLEQLIPKITDFGLAKLVVEGEQEKQRSGSVMGTPSYMPPEQAEGRNWQVGPPADIYSLGAVLYDLLTGKPPFRGTTVVETLRMVCTFKPRPPAEFNPAVPHDLQVICLKCLEKEPGRRYRSARELAADLRAFLDGAPISARSYSRWELTTKWVRRRPTAAALLGVSVLALLSLALGGVFIARQQSALAREEEAGRKLAELNQQQAERHAVEEEALRKEAERERDRAEANFKEARAAVSELTSVGHRRLASVPHMEGVRRELLDKALRFHEQFLAINGDRPGQRHELARSQLRVAEIQEMLGRQPPAEKAYRQALQLFQILVREAPRDAELRRDLAATWNDLAILQQAMNQTSAAQESFTEALTLKAQLVSEQPGRPELHRDLANSYNSRGHLRLAIRQPKEAEQDYQEALRLLTELSRELNQAERWLEDIARTQNNLGALAMGAGGVNRSTHAAEAFEASIRCWTTLAKRSPHEPRFRHELATALGNRAALLHLQGKSKEAVPDYEQATALLVVLTGEHSETLAHRELLASTRHNHGQLLRELERHGDSEKVWQAALPLWRRLAEDFPRQPSYRQKLAQTLNERAVALASVNRLKEVEALWEEAVALQEQLVREQPRRAEYWQDLVNSRANLAGLLKVLPLTERTEKAARELVEVQQRRLKTFPDVPAYQGDRAAAHALLSEVLLMQHRPDDACQELTEAVYQVRRARAAEPREAAHEQGLHDYSLGVIELHLRKERHVEGRRVLTELMEALPAERGKATRLAPEQAALLRVRCLRATEKDMRLAAEERKRCITADADAALELLRRAVAQGFSDGESLKTEAWQPLQGHDDFQAILKQLKPKN